MRLISLVARMKPASAFSAGTAFRHASERHRSRPLLQRAGDEGRNACAVGHSGRRLRDRSHRPFRRTKKSPVVAEDCTAHPENTRTRTLLSVGAGSLEAEIHGLANDLGISDHVLFLGEREDIAELLKAMDVFLLPSLYEGLPIVAVEAQAANVKLVMSTGGLRGHGVIRECPFCAAGCGPGPMGSRSHGRAERQSPENRKWKLLIC